MTAVNFPEVSIPVREGTHRLLHIHQNVPGVLSQVNASFADAGINILAQSLMTEDNVGYLVMDVDDDDSAAALDKLKAIDETIRCGYCIREDAPPPAIYPLNLYLLKAYRRGLLLKLCPPSYENMVYRWR